MWLDVFLNFDFSVLDFIAESIRNSFLDPIMWGLSMFANKGLGWALLGLILLIPKKTRLAGVISLVSLLVTLLVGEYAIKPIFCRTRPYDMYETFHGVAMPFTLNAGSEHSFSFPSGHTGASFAAAVSMFKINKTAGFIALIFAALIGFSRLYNYVHYPTDVFAGMILGTLVALCVMFIFKATKLENKLKPRNA